MNDSQKKESGSRHSLSLLKLRARLFKKVKANPRLHLRYLKLANRFSNRGFSPPLTAPVKQHEARWREQGTGDSKVAPEVYAQHNASVETLFMDVLPLLSTDCNILEIGCNAGRSLNYLYDKGFKNLTGIEIGGKALEIFKDSFPDSFASTRVIHGNAVEEIRNLESKTYDLVFTHSVLVNIGAKHNDFFREMCRVCKGFILTLESEGSSQAFPRDFEKMFAKNGFAMVGYKWLVWDDAGGLSFPHPVTGKSVLKNNSIRLFAPVEKT